MLPAVRGMRCASEEINHDDRWPRHEVAVSIPSVRHAGGGGVCRASGMGVAGDDD